MLRTIAHVIFMTAPPAPNAQHQRRRESAVRWMLLLDLIVAANV
jgi:hypothetical protein